ncbi:MAG: 6-bladed beta-propeller [Bacteroidales bacterium]|nr:6-bladed beta-propeller [Bacteroidales bacterium]
MIILSRILILSLVALSCQIEQNKDKNRVMIFDLKKLPKVTSIKLSDLGFEDIEYIPLESNEQSMISGTEDLITRNKLVIGEKNFLIQRLSTILEFQTDGRYITRIGTKGRGPNEFTAAHDVNINETNQDIYLLARWQKKFFVYSQNGKLLRMFQVPFSPSEFHLIDDKILCYSENHMGDIQNSYTLIDTNGKVIKNFPNKYPFKNHDAYGISAENLFYRFENKLFKKEVYSDTIYLYDNKNFTPHMVIQVGEKLLSPKARTEFDGLYLAKNYIIPLNLFEFGDYVYYEFVYRYVIPNDVLIFSFIGSKKNSFKAIINTGQGIVNDLDGGLNILPKTIKDDNTIIGWVDALKLKAHVASEVFKNSTPKYPEKKKELEKLANRLKETDNPVLVLVRLKK